MITAAPGPFQSLEILGETHHKGRCFAMQSSETLEITAEHEMRKTEGGGRGVTKPSNSKRLTRPLLVSPAKATQSRCRHHKLRHLGVTQLGGMSRPKSLMDNNLRESDTRPSHLTLLSDTK